MSEWDELNEFLESATGKLTVEINGMVPHIEGNCNEAGAIMAAFSGIKLVQTQSGKSFEEIVGIMSDLQEVMNYTIINRKEQGV